jgi:hypothetical protein
MSRSSRGSRRCALIADFLDAEPVRGEAADTTILLFHERDDLLGDGARRLLRHIVSTAYEHAAAHVSGDETHGFDQGGADACFHAEGELRNGQPVFSNPHRSRNHRLCCLGGPSMSGIVSLNGGRYARSGLRFRRPPVAEPDAFATPSVSNIIFRPQRCNGFSDQALDRDAVVIWRVGPTNLYDH